MQHMVFMLIAVLSMLIFPGQGISDDEIAIVQYGSVEIKSSEPGARVYIDGEYMGDADLFIENVTVGEHAISLKLGAQEVSGEFVVRKNETLSLMARFDEGRLVVITATQKAHAQRTDAGPKTSADKKKVVQEPDADRRRLFVNVIKTSFDDAKTDDLRVIKKANPKAVSGYSEKSGQKGKYYRNKANVLLCEAGPCTREWSAAFYYTDEDGRRDTIRISWTETVFEYVTVTGVSKTTLEWCVNDTCRTVETGGKADKGTESSIDRYTLTWKRPSIIIRRADLIKAMTASGARVPEF